MAERKSYSLADLVAQCDPNAPMPEALREWDQAAAVGLEQVVMGDQVDIREAVLVHFRDDDIVTYHAHPVPVARGLPRNHH